MEYNHYLHESKNSINAGTEESSSDLKHLRFIPAHG